MSIENPILLAMAVFVLAALPGPGILLTLGRTLTAGLKHASFVVLGIVLGDLIFILLVTLGLSLLAQNLSGLFLVIKYAGGLYLLYLGLSLIWNRSATLPLSAQPQINNQQTSSQQCPSKSSYMADMIAGLVVTLSNPKALVFYLSFLPTFVDIPQLKPVDIALIIAIICPIIGVVMMAYALSAYKAATLLRGKSQQNWLQKMAGGFIFLTGGWLLARQ